MNWLDWLLASWFALGAFLVITLVGKPRKPITPNDAAVVAAINAALIVLVVVYG